MRCVVLPCLALPYHALHALHHFGRNLRSDISGAKLRNSQAICKPLLIPHQLNLLGLTATQVNPEVGENPFTAAERDPPESHSSSANLPSQRGTSASQTGLRSRGKGLLRDLCCFRGCISRGRSSKEGFGGGGGALLSNPSTSWPTDCLPALFCFCAPIYRMLVTFLWLPRVAPLLYIDRSRRIISYLMQHLLFILADI
jgi:hypothetical protein